MKKGILIIAAISMMSFSGFSQAKKSLSDEMATLMTHMKKYTLELAHQMNQDQYEYRPAESKETRTFAQHFKHIKNFMGFQLSLLKQEQVDFRKIIPKNKAYENSSLSKEQIISDLSDQFDEVINFFESTSDKNLERTYQFVWEDERPRRSRLLITMALRDHISHHRAQAIIYLRENGIKPAQYQRY